ncbi:type II toxin-antitoxin system mRNA interferase toxin, RelE/StbE family [Helicobacter pylori]|nr:type II toxin-antitoxin system mRNA interferase toxin, RelE/StbE family [Helicobacter pylori]
MLKVRTKKDFLKDFNKHILSGRITESDVTSIVDCLKEQKPLQQKYCDHALSGNLKGLRECHVMLLIYEIKKQENELVLLRLDTHSELFKK